MPTIQIEANLSSEQLLNAARQMSFRELDRFIKEVLVLRAQLGQGTLPVAESELLLKINQPVPADVQQRYDELIARRDGARHGSSRHEYVHCRARLRRYDLSVLVNIVPQYVLALLAPLG